VTFLVGKSKEDAYQDGGREDPARRPGLRLPRGGRDCGFDAGCPHGARWFLELTR